MSMVDFATPQALICLVFGILVGVVGIWLAAGRQEEDEVIELSESQVVLSPVADGIWYDKAGHYVFSAPYLMRNWPTEDARKMLDFVTRRAVEAHHA